jgi:hypothetical protein
MAAASLHPIVAAQFRIIGCSGVRTLVIMGADYAVLSCGLACIAAGDVKNVTKFWPTFFVTLGKKIKEMFL